MATNKELEKQVKALTDQVDTLTQEVNSLKENRDTPGQPLDATEIASFQASLETQREISKEQNKIISLLSEATKTIIGNHPEILRKIKEVEELSNQ